TGTIFNNVTFNCTGTATMGAGVGNFSVASSGVLTLVSPAKLVAGSAAAAYLTLKSDATGSATVAALSGTSTITGYVNVQRYVTGGSSTYRGYRLLSSPVYVSTVSGNNVYSLNYLKNSSYLSGSGGTGGSFDKAGNPTLYLYRENLAPGNSSFTAGNFRGIANIASAPGYTLDNEVGTYNIPIGNGFLFFFRGNRSTSLASKTVSPYTAPENTTLTATGTLAQGQITVHNWYTPASVTIGYTATAGNTAVRGFNLVGNPYASSINWDLFNTITSTSGIYGVTVGTTIYVLDPVSHNFGAYTKGSGGIGTHNASNVIPSGQGFFVVASAATGKLIFNESAKVSTQVTGLNLLMGKPMQEYTNLQYLHLVLAKDSVNTDDIIIHLKSGAPTVYDAETEALYRTGQGVVSLSSMSSDKFPLAINVQPLPKKTLTIALSASASASGYYKLNLQKVVGISKLYSIWLVDNFTKDSVDMREAISYNFAIDKADSNSFGPNRFKLIISQNKGFAYHLVKFTATKGSDAAPRQVNLAWQTKNEENYTHFTVERSTDNGNTFEVIGWKQSSGHENYAMIDKDPQPGINIYRLKQEDINNEVTYSQPVKIAYSELSNNIAKTNLTIFPNPAKSNITLTIIPLAGAVNKENYKIRISNSSGLVVRDINASQMSWQGSVNDLTIGTYVVQVWNTKDQTLVGQTKFVKL
ncbi:MAG TPA: T9SS type A sorting domain-containing protein, partial [Mucilaginibacter sp.]|nr:T9SS type A sorting domain-containing protein [Mucilaginibacter sp.]